MRNIKIKGILIRTCIMGKTKDNQVLVSVNIKRLSRALFHTSKGEVELSFNVSCIQVDSKQGSLEFIAGTFPEARNLARRIMNENIAFDDVGTFIELEMNQEELNKIIERALIKRTNQSSLSPKDIDEKMIVKH